MIPIAAIQSETVLHTFTLKPDRTVQRVNLAGTFNNWDRQATPMKLDGDGKTYRVSVRLSPGRHQYKFVLDGDTWITDPMGKSMPDGNGNTNSVLLILPEDYRGAASPQDGVTAKSALRHMSELPDLNYDRGKLTVTLRARPGDLASVSVQVGGKSVRAIERANPSDELYTRYVAQLPWNRRSDLRYRFVLRDGTKTLYLGKGGLSPRADSPAFTVSRNYRPFEVPRWVEQSVIYQIFPDRFENGDPSNDPKNVVPWDGKPEYFNHFGGDVAGIQKRLDYLEQLGVRCIYFNPIFQSPSNHRYDTVDYLRVEPEFGTNAEFSVLTRQLKARGIRTVLDGVFNHTAVDFPQFADVRKNGEASKYTRWYTFRSFPVRVQNNPNYEAWFNFPSMPKLNLGNPETRDYLLDIPRFWDRHAEIAGWRLDVANEVSMDYWRQFRKVVKGIDRDNWIVGEHWGDATPWLKGDQWDSVMNYQFRGAVLGFVGREGDGKAGAFLDRLFSLYDSQAPQVSRNMMNLVGSHDTPRILTLCGGDRELAKLAATIQMTWVGTPSVYYGDELGMEGGADPENRRGMRWDLVNDRNDMLNHYRRLIAARNSSRALQSGDPVRVATSDADATAAFARVLDREAAIVVLNRSDRERSVRINVRRLPIKNSLTDILARRKVSVDTKGFAIVPMPPKGGAVLIPD
jgi:glycosidase